MFVKRALALALLLSAPAAAQDAASLAWVQHPGAALPPGIALQDEAGKRVSLQDVFGRGPVILDLGYYHCPSLCGVVRADLMNALAHSGLVAGRDVGVLALSIDPAETPRDAASAKRMDIAQSPEARVAAWHYWTGTAPAIGAVAGAVGFRDRYDGALRQFMHPAGVVILTADGRVSGYLLGVGYSGGDLRAAVLRARDGGIARAALPILLLCFHFDAATGRYTLAIMKVLRLLAGLTVLTLLGLFAVLARQGRRRGGPTVVTRDPATQVQRSTQER